MLTGLQFKTWGVAMILSTLLAVAPGVQEPQAGSLEASVEGRIRDAVVVVMWRHRDLIKSSLGFLVSPDGHVLFAHSSVQPGEEISEIKVVLRSGTLRQEVRLARIVETETWRNLSLARIDLAGGPYFPILPEASLREKEEVWVAAVPNETVILEENTHPVSFIKGMIEKPPGSTTSMQVKINTGLLHEGGAVVNAQGQLVGIYGANAPGYGNSMSIKGVEECLSLDILQARVKPRVLPPEGGLLSIQATLRNLHSVDRVYAIVEGAGMRVEVALKGNGITWSGDWACPPLNAEGRQRTEFQRVSKDQSFDAGILKVGEIRLKTKTGLRIMKVEDASEIRLGEEEGSDRVFSANECFEGTVDEKALDFTRGEGSTILLERKSGRRFEVTVVAVSKGQETRRVLGVFVGDVEELKPVGPLASPSVGGIVEKRFPGIPGRVLPCGGGRYLLVHFSNLHTLGVFDFHRLEFIKHLRLEREPVLFAGGRDKLLIFYPGRSRLERWSLRSWESEVIRTDPFPYPPQALLLGWDSGGPAMVVGRLAHDRQAVELKLFDVERMQVIPGVPRWIRVGFSKELHLRSSPGGERLTWWDRSAGGACGVLNLDDESSRAMTAPMYGALIPGAMDTLFAGECRLTATEQAGPGKWRRVGESGVRMIPALGGPLYLSLVFKTGENSKLRGVIKGLSGGQKILTLDFPVFESWTNHGREAGPDELTRENRIWFHPRAKVIVTLPASNDRLVCRPLDVEALLGDSGVDYFYIDSVPRVFVPSGARWTYPLVIKSKRGSIVVRLERAPDGMRIEEGNVLTWRASTPGDHFVRVLASDASGQELEHDFTLRVR